MLGFTLLDVSLYTDEEGRMPVPLRGPEALEPLVLPEGAVLSVGLTFLLARPVDALTFEDSRSLDGLVLVRTRQMLGGFRAGGPYEVRLPSERLPVGRAHCGTYEVTGRFTDGDGRALAEESHLLRIVHVPAPA